MCYLITNDNLIIFNESIWPSDTSLQPNVIKNRKTSLDSAVSMA